jgi:hypothetical protein
MIISWFNELPGEKIQEDEVFLEKLYRYGEILVPYTVRVYKQRRIQWLATLFVTNLRRKRVWNGLKINVLKTVFLNIDAHFKGLFLKLYLQVEKHCKFVMYLGMACEARYLMHQAFDLFHVFFKLLLFSICNPFWKLRFMWLLS